MKVHHVTRFVLLFILFFSCIAVKAQTKYFIVRSNDKSYDVKSYTLKTNALYQIDKEIELFNLLTKSPIVNGTPMKMFQKDLILFSVLPDLKTDTNWEMIDLDSIKSDTLHFSKLSQLLMKSTHQYFDYSYPEQTKYFNAYKLVVYKDGNYMVAKNTLLQFFAIRNRPSVFNSVFGTINIDQDQFTVLDMLNYYDAKKLSDFPLVSFLDQYATFDRRRERKEFLSKKAILKGDTTYQFWTFVDWPERHAYNTERGIDRFIYIPNKGIIAGSFDFYFAYHAKEINLNWVKFLDNIYKERVLIADEYREE